MFDFGPMLDAAGAELDRRRQACEVAVEQFMAVRVIGQSQENTPVETGALMASATWGKATSNGNSIECEGGFNLEYAAARHEAPPEEDLGNAQNESGTAGWKFMERAMRNIAGEFTTFVGSRISNDGQQ